MDQVVARRRVGERDGTVVFRCPGCSRATVVVVGPTTIALAILHGVRIESWDWPLELREPHPEGPTFVTDDLIEFHSLLERRDDVVALMR